MCNNKARKLIDDSRKILSMTHFDTTDKIANEDQEDEVHSFLRQYIGDLLQLHTSTGIVVPDCRSYNTKSTDRWILL